MRTPLRNLRIDTELWEAAQRSAAEQGTSVSAVIVAALERYVKSHPTAMTVAERAQEKRKKKIRTLLATDPPATPEEVEQLIAIMRRG